MTDIAERLRSQMDQIVRFNGGELRLGSGDCEYKRYWDALAEIERLRDLVSCEFAETDHPCCPKEGEPEECGWRVCGRCWNELGKSHKRLQEIEKAARSYVDIRSNHPQVAGEAWRFLVDALTQDGETGGSE